MSEQAPAGWYPDGSGNERFWDGSAWTDQLRALTPPPPGPPAPTPPNEDAAIEGTADAPNGGTGLWSKFGSSVKKIADDRRTARAEAAAEHQARATAAGAMITSGVFGVSTIEIYEGGYVRIAEGTENYTRPAEITKNTPYERLRSISFGVSDADAAAAAESTSSNSAIEGAVMQAMSGIVKGGKLLTKGTIVGVATTGISQIAANTARKSNLVIGTDKAIHTLSNQRHNGVIKVSQKEHDAVARALVEAGNAVLGIKTASEPAPVIDAVAVASAPAVAPTLSDRLRELSELHREGILSDDEFASAKAQLLSGL